MEEITFKFVSIPVNYETLTALIDLTEAASVSPFYNPVFANCNVQRVSPTVCNQNGVYVIQ